MGNTGKEAGAIIDRRARLSNHRDASFVWSQLACPVTRERKRCFLRLAIRAALWPTGFRNAHRGFRGSPGLGKLAQRGRAGGNPEARAGHIGARHGMRRRRSLARVHRMPAGGRGCCVAARHGDGRRPVADQRAGSEINALVTQIASGAAEQANAIREVNEAIKSMDRATQQNATMVEESTAASHTLGQQTPQLARLIEQFNVGAPRSRRELKRSGSWRALSECRPTWAVRRGARRRKLRCWPVL